MIALSFLNWATLVLSALENEVGKSEICHAYCGGVRQKLLTPPRSLCNRRCRFDREQGYAKSFQASFT